MQRLLFLRDFRRPRDGRVRISGGHVKLRDYFDHALAHPQLDPYLYFTPRSRFEDSELWAGVPRDRIVRAVEPGEYDLAFVTGKDWKLLPKERRPSIVHYLQSLEQCAPDSPVFSLLRKPAFRICVSDAVDQASAPHRNGGAVVIPDGIPLELFRPGAKRRGSVLIWGHKDPDFAMRLAERLRHNGFEPAVVDGYLLRADLAAQLAETDIFVGVPKPREGFFLPALEAMAAGCAVVCPDALGNRGFCIDGDTCIMPPHGDLAAHAASVERLRRDQRFADSLRRRAIEVASGHSLEAERAAFFRALDEHVLTDTHVHRHVS